MFATDVTDASGLYLLDIGSGAASFSWIVEFVLPAGLQFSPANQGGNDALDSDVIDFLTGRTASIAGVTLPSGAPLLTVDAGMFAVRVPEPGTLPLIAVALLALSGLALRRSRALARR